MTIHNQVLNIGLAIAALQMTTSQVAADQPFASYNSPLNLVRSFRTVDFWPQDYATPVARPRSSSGIIYSSGTRSSGSYAAPSYQRSTSSSYQRLPRPATGYGSNLHRNFVIRKEQNRAKSGKSVRNAGNVLWRR